jgi:alcohol dehydrogenase
MPAGVTATTGIDAISHAIESFVTTKRNAISQLFSRRAWRLLVEAFPVVTAAKLDLPSSGTASSLTGPDHAGPDVLGERSAMIKRVEARGRMLLGAHLAGAAIENSMLGATHALANPLTAHFGVTHGCAIGVMLPHVIRFNASAVPSLYGRLAADLGLCAANDPGAGNLIADLIQRLVFAAELPTSLRACRVDAQLLPTLAEEASHQWTGTFNPRPVDAMSLLKLYQSAFDS